MRFSNVVVFFFTLIFTTALASPIPNLKDDGELKKRFDIGEVVSVATKDLSHSSLADTTGKAIITDLDHDAGKATLAPIITKASEASSKLKSIVPSIEHPALNGQVHTGDAVTADISKLSTALGGKVKATESEVAKIKSDVEASTKAKAAAAAAAPNTSGLKKGDIVNVAPNDLEPDPLPNSGSAEGKATQHPAIVTGIDDAGKAIVAPISHTATAVSKDITALLPDSKGLTGFIHLGSEVKADVSKVTKTGSSVSGNAVKKIKAEIAKNI